MITQKFVFHPKLKTWAFWQNAIGWIMSLYVMGLGALILLNGAWQGFVYFLLGAVVHPKVPAPIWVRIVVYVFIILLL